MDPISARLRARHPQRIDLSLDRMRALCAALGDPQHRLPPVVHVAGTNGKGSTVAMIRAIAEAAGLRVHAYTSPHLVRFNERIRLAGKLIEDAGLKGFSVGGAAVSEKHAGFVINKDHGTAADILGLCNEVKRRVKESSGVDLELEVKLLGEF